MTTRHKCKKLNIAFLTPEFVTDLSTGGGLGNYLNRMTKACLEVGHQPEIFVRNDRAAETFDYEGVTVHRVPGAAGHRAVRLAERLFRMPVLKHHRRLVWKLSGALGLSEALAARERDDEFDLVQSADFMASGLFVKYSKRRPRVVRCSCAPDLWAVTDQDSSWYRYWSWRLEIAAIRRADIAYAPSQFVADHLRSEFRIKAHVVRPPVLQESKTASDSRLSLPQRYLIHFGQLIRRKGTDWLARALPLVWKEEPEFCMVWAGGSNEKDVRQWRTLWGQHSDQVLLLGAIEKPQLYQALTEAEAAVLPSLADNLPNTVIESLMFGIPVIGTDGASVDELVTPGVSGCLVTMGDVSSLASALIRAWRGELGVSRRFRWECDLRDQMVPQAAVTRFLRLAGLGEEATNSEVTLKTTPSLP